jgi:hypothetical protein
MSKIQKAFAVAPGTPRPRRTAYGPKSAGWTLYRIADLADKLGVDVVSADVALETTGFNKAVRIREELIRWKERLRAEERDIADERDRLLTEAKKLGLRLSVVREELGNVRNILRLPREDATHAGKELEAAHG